MPIDYLHNHAAFIDLLLILGNEMKIDPYLVEKDYWLMHSLYGLDKQNFVFELKGGTSLSKGYNLIDRFSEDLDIYIHPPAGQTVEENPRKIKSKDSKSRQNFYDWLSTQIQIDGIEKTGRDRMFDDLPNYRSGGIRLYYKSYTSATAGIKDGILLEAGFSTVTPFNRIDISSWAYERAVATPGISIIDNRATHVACYDPGYTLVEKLQTITTKFRRYLETGTLQPNLLRQYYDVSSLLKDPKVQQFIGTAPYIQHKKDWFSNADKSILIGQNEAFLLNDPINRTALKAAYEKTKSLYYNGQPSFESVLALIHLHINHL